MSRRQDKRYIDNPFHDYDHPTSSQFMMESLVADENGYQRLNINSELGNRIKEACQIMYKGIHDAYFPQRETGRRRRDYSVYTGLSGILYLYQELGLPWSEEILTECLQSSDLNSFLGYLCGITGPLAFSAAYSSHKEKHLKALIQLKDSKLFHESPEEFLYGKAGYLYSLLLVKRENPNFKEIDSAIHEVINVILRKGASRGSTPLYYEWYDEEYLGAAHGYAGILATLLRAKSYLNSSQLDLIRSKIDELIQLQAVSGNFPPSVPSIGDDRLVHWCHGAPGFADLYLLAFEVYKDEKYSRVAERCLDDIWRRGLLKKGFGLCHGSSGNGYSFLLAYKSTKRPKYLYRALRFAEWCTNFGNSQCRTPDCPFSLFEGLAGNLFFLHHVQGNVRDAYFPCYTL